ncbi:MAG: PAS domain S-box protein [Desulfobulbaceae bacterium]|nr:MAG: PAS domain S-box protein [Desulfobulbaceae bacterium]
MVCTQNQMGIIRGKIFCICSKRHLLTIPLRTAEISCIVKVLQMHCGPSTTAADHPASPSCMPPAGSVMKNDCPPLAVTSTVPDIDPGKRTLPAGAGSELFHAIPDPALVVTPEGVIVEVNMALLRASGRNREDILGHGVCEIIHGGRWPHIKCPLEEFIKTRSSRVEDTRLPGLGGEYSLTVVPV